MGDRDVHSIDTHEYVRRDNHLDDYVAYQKVFFPVVSGRFPLGDAEVAYRYYRKSPESVSSPRQSLAASLAPSGLGDFYGGNLDGN